MTARRFGLLACGATALVGADATATEQWEVRAGGLGLQGDERLAWEASAGAAFDAYVTDGVGALLGLDAVVLGFPDHGGGPSDLGVAPELTAWLGEDVPRFRSTLTVRPVFGVLDLDEGGVRAFQRLEVGPGWGLAAEDGSARARVALLWTPATDPGDGSLEPLAFGLRLTLAWAPPVRLPPKPAGSCPLPCTPGCPC